MRRWWWRVSGAAAALLALMPAAGCVIHRPAPYVPVQVNAEIEGGVAVYFHAQGDPAGDAAWRFFPQSGGGPMPWPRAAVADDTVRVSGNLSLQQCEAIVFL